MWSQCDTARSIGSRTIITSFASGTTALMRSGTSGNDGEEYTGDASPRTHGFKRRFSVAKRPESHDALHGALILSERDRGESSIAGVEGA